MEVSFGQSPRTALESCYASSHQLDNAIWLSKREKGLKLIERTGKLHGHGRGRYIDYLGLEDLRNISDLASCIRIGSELDQYKLALQRSARSHFIDLPDIHELLNLADYLLNYLPVACYDDRDAAYIGIYHDAYRYSCDESTPAFCREHGIDVFPEEEAEPMLLHGALAAIHFPEDAGGSVPEYFRTAVRHHTLGHKEMGPYGAILYIADYMEPGRKHLDDDDRRRILSGERLEDMIITIMDMQNSYFSREGI